MPNAPGIPIILSAPSGTGKTTACRMLKERFPDMKVKVSHTTREPRDGETQGVHYHFISESDFEKRKNQNEFLEWAKVHNAYYGTSKEMVENCIQTGHDILMELDVQGAESLRKMNFDGVFIIILPPSIEELRNRLIKRGTEPESKINDRIETGKKEIAKFQVYDYVVVNHKIEDTVDTIEAILRAEKARSKRFQPENPEMLSLIKNSVTA